MHAFPTLKQQFGAVPDKLLADWAEGGLGEKSGRELMTLHQVDFSLFDRTTTLMQRKYTLSLSLRLSIAISLTMTCIYT